VAPLPGTDGRPCGWPRLWPTFRWAWMVKANGRNRIGFFVKDTYKTMVKYDHSTALPGRVVIFPAGINCRGGVNGVLITAARNSFMAGG